MQRAAGNAGVAQEFKSIFELGGVPAFNQYYTFGIFIWKLLYKGFYTAWHLVPAPTIENPKRKRKIFRMNMAKAVCAEMASLVWGEECTVNVSMDGRNSEDPDPLDEFVQKVLAENAMREKMQESVEQALALGGAALKVYSDVRHDANGNEIPDTRRVCIGYAMADQFVPTAWDNAKVTEGVFISRQAKDGYYYTRLEWHKWDGLTYTITNELYRSEMRRAENGESQDILGIRWPLADVYPFLEEETVIPVSESLFTYWRTPIANNLDDNSPLGISIYANCMDTLKALDIAFDSLAMEMILGKKRIIVPASAVRSVRDSKGFEHRYFDANDEVYEALYTDSAEQLKIQDNTVELRIDDHVRAINALLDILSFQIGLSEGTLSFDKGRGIKTATEVISENSKTYRTVKLMQKPIKQSIKDMIDEIIDISCAYDISFTFNGREYNVYDLVRNGYNVVVSFDDSIIQDKDSEKADGLRDLQNGVLSKKTYMIKYMHMTPEEADAELQRISDEGKLMATARAVDIDWSNLEV